MTEVLIVLNGVPGRPSVLADAVAGLHADGVRVTIAAGCPADRIAVPDGTADVRGLPAVKAMPRGDRNEYPHAIKGRRLWLRVRNDAEVRRRAAAADVLVALDPNAVHSIWQLARRNRTADAVYGLAPALAAVAKRRTEPAATGHLLRRMPHPAIAVDAVRERADRLTRRAGRLTRRVGRRTAGMAPSGRPRRLLRTVRTASRKG